MNMLEAIEQVGRATTDDEIASVISRFAQKVGYGWWHIARPFADDLSLNRRKIISAWPKAWMEQYDHQKLAGNDAIYKSFKVSLRPFRWSDVHIENDGAKRVMEIAASDFGMTHGFCVPYFGLSGYQGGISFAGANTEVQTEHQLSLEVLAIYAFNRLNEIKASTASIQSKLTPRQREVMHWIAAGKSAWDIAAILNISMETVRTTTKQAMLRLNVHTRAQAVAEALRLGEIIP